MKTNRPTKIAVSLPTASIDINKNFNHKRDLGIKDIKKVERKKNLRFFSVQSFSTEVGNLMTSDSEMVNHLLGRNYEPTHVTT